MFERGLEVALPFCGEMWCEQRSVHVVVTEIIPNPRWYLGLSRRPLEGGKKEAGSKE